MSWTGAVAPWLPTLVVIVLAALALTEAQSPPVTAAASRLWLAGLLLVGLFGIAGTVWQEEKAADHIQPFEGASNSEETAAMSRLTHRVKLLEEQLKEREGRQTSLINGDAAAKLADYLRPFGPRRVIVSCVPDGDEAYTDANRFVNVLRSAKWDAQGPQVTEIFGAMRARGINVFVNSDDRSDTARILLDGFAKFNIPYQPRVTPTGAIPDAETVELFIGSKPSVSARSGSE
jgi:hypothetical protein